MGLRICPKLLLNSVVRDTKHKIHRNSSVNLIFGQNFFLILRVCSCLACKRQTVQYANYYSKQTRCLNMTTQIRNTCIIIFSKFFRNLFLAGCLQGLARNDVSKSVFVCSECRLIEPIVEHQTGFLSESERCIVSGMTMYNR